MAKLRFKNGWEAILDANGVWKSDEKVLADLLNIRYRLLDQEPQDPNPVANLLSKAAEEMDAIAEDLPETEWVESVVY